MTRTVNVTACTLRRDDKYLILFKSKAGPGQACRSRAGRSRSARQVPSHG